MHQVVMLQNIVVMHRECVMDKGGKDTASGENPQSPAR